MATRLQLPASFAATHDTDGLPGYQAIDVFGSPGTPVRAPAGGVLTNVHFINWDAKKRVGGWTAYLVTPSGTYFLTHFGKIMPKSGAKITAGQVIGTVGAVPGNAWDPHIHEGYNGDMTSVTSNAAPKAQAPPQDELKVGDQIAADVANAPVMGAAVGPNVLTPVDATTPPPQATTAQPRIETWRMLSGLPGASNDTMRLADLAAYDDAGA